MNDADIALLWAERWDQIDPTEMVDFTTLEPVAMSETQTITRAADDVNHIAKRLKEIAEERAQAQRNSDPGQASGEYLDNIARSWGLVRSPPSESDYAFRQRIIKAAGGE
jgi:hypothetical protein